MLYHSCSEPTAAHLYDLYRRVTDRQNDDMQKDIGITALAWRCAANCQNSAECVAVQRRLNTFKQEAQRYSKMFDRICADFTSDP